MNSAQYLIKQAIIGAMFPQPDGRDAKKGPVSEIGERLKRRRNMPGKKLSMGELMMC